MPLKQPQIKIAIVDDHKLFRKGLINLIHAVNKDKYHILFEAENGSDFKAQIDKKILPDIVIMDIDMPNTNGFETVDWLQKIYPDIKILVVSMIEREEAIVRMLRLGVKGYLSKDIEPEDLHRALTAIVHRGYYYTDFITGKLVHSIQNNSFDKEINTTTSYHNLWNTLNENERKFIKYACTDMTYEEIASQMNLSPKTIDGYRKNIFEKFNLRNRVALVLFAIKNQLVSI